MTNAVEEMRTYIYVEMGRACRRLCGGRVSSDKVPAMASPMLCSTVERDGELEVAQDVGGERTKTRARGRSNKRGPRGLSCFYKGENPKWQA